MIKRLIHAILTATLSAALVLAVLLAWTHYRPRPPAPPLPPLTEQIDRIEVDKSDRTLTVFKGDEALRTYPIALGFAPDGDKFQQGDGKTPEGEFTIDRRNDKSAFHLSLGINYPQSQHTARANAKGVSPGGDIFIHGQPNEIGESPALKGDWTAGCIAVSNDQIRELWRITKHGTKVIIRP